MSSETVSPTLDKTDKPRATPAPLKAAAILAALYFLSKLTGLFQQQIIMATLPLEDKDAYAAAFNLTDFVNYFIAGGALSITFIPFFTELRERGREKEAWEFFSALATLMTVVTTALIALCVVFAEPLTQLFTPGLDSPNRETNILPLAVLMTQIILPAQIFFYLGGLLVGVLNSQKRFAATGFTGALYNVVAILVAVIGWQITKSPVAFAVGILIGAIAGNFVLPLLAVWRGPADLRPQFRLNFNWRNPLLKQFFLTALPIMLGVSFPVVDQIVVKWFASETEGLLTYLWSGNRLMIVVQGVLAQAASVAAFPYMASDSAAQNWQKLADFIRTGLRRLVFIALAISTWMILTATPTVSLLLGWGESDTPTVINPTAVAYAFYTAGLFAWAGQQLVARGFYALKDTKTPTIVGSIITVFFFIPLVWLCAKSSHAELTLPLATSIGACTHFAVLLLYLQKKLAAPPYEVNLGAHRVCGTLLRTASACALMGIAGLIAAKLLNYLPLEGKTGDLVRIIGISAAALPVFAFAAHRFDIPEAQWLFSRVAGRFKK